MRWLGYSWVLHTSELCLFYVTKHYAYIIELNIILILGEIKQKVIIQQSIDRGPYICQAQSLNLFFTEPNYTLLSSALFYGWKNGLKTGSYYIRSRPNVQAQQFTLDPKLIAKMKEQNKKINDQEIKPDVCENCSA